MTHSKPLALSSVGSCWAARRVRCKISPSASVQLVVPQALPGPLRRQQHAPCSTRRPLHCVVCVLSVRFHTWIYSDGVCAVVNGVGEPAQVHLYRSACKKCRRVVLFVLYRQRKICLCALPLYAMPPSSHMRRQSPLLLLHSSPKRKDTTRSLALSLPRRCDEGGAGTYVAELVACQSSLVVRCTTQSHVYRVSSPTPTTCTIISTWLSWGWSSGLNVQRLWMLTVGGLRRVCARMHVLL